MVDDLDFARHRLASMEELGTLQNLGRDDLEVFSTIKDPFGLETKKLLLIIQPHCSQCRGWRWSELIPDLAFQADPL